MMLFGEELIIKSILIKKGESKENSLCKEL